MWFCLIDTAPFFCFTFLVSKLSLWRDVAGLLSKIGANSYSSLLCYWARSQYCEKRLLALSCLSVRPHEKTWLSLDGFSWHLIFKYFSEVFFFFIHGSVHRDSILIRSNKMQQYAGVYLLHIYSTCFGCPSHPSSGAHKTVTAASGTGVHLYQRLQLQSCVLLTLGAMNTGNT